MNLTKDEFINLAMRAIKKTPVVLSAVEHSCFGATLQYEFWNMEDERESKNDMYNDSATSPVFEMSLKRVRN